MERMVMTRTDAKAALGVALVNVDKLLNREKDPIPSIRVGRRILIPVDGFRAWLARQTENGLTNN